MSVTPDIQSLCQNKNQAAPTIDSEREEFRKYLESGAVLKVMTRVMKDLYEMENKPADPLNFLTSALGAVNFNSRETALLQDELRSLKLVLKQLEEENRFLRGKLEEIDSD